MLINRYKVGADGKTPRQRLKGKKFTKAVAEFGENVMYLKPKSRGVDKLNTRWGEGVWLGIRELSGEVYIGTEEGVIKVRSIRRKSTEAERWNWIKFQAIKGTPWEPEPGRFNVEIKSKVALPKDAEEVVKQLEVSDREVIKRRMYIKKADVLTHGMTEHCKGCAAVNAHSTVSRNHGEACRERFMKIFEDSGDSRIARVTERLEEKQDTVSAPVEGEEVTPEENINDTDDYAGVYNMMLNLTADDDVASKLTNKVCKVTATHKQDLDSDIARMNDALTKEGFSHSIIEVYSPPRVTGMGDMLGIMQCMALGFNVR
jgi:hypothetical protein